MKYLKLYCDVDGVLADFDRMFEDVTGIHPTEYVKSFSRDLFWSTIIKEPDFWLRIKPMKNAGQLFDFIQERFDHWMILTSPSNEDRTRAMFQKKQWLNMHFGVQASSRCLFYQSEEKHVLACPNSILIDDWRQNTDYWHKSGGVAIKHETVTTTISQLKKIIGK